MNACFANHPTTISLIWTFSRFATKNNDSWTVSNSIDGVLCHNQLAFLHYCNPKTHILHNEQSKQEKKIHQWKLLEFFCEKPEMNQNNENNFISHIRRYFESIICCASVPHHEISVNIITWSDPDIMLDNYPKKETISWRVSLAQISFRHLRVETREEEKWIYCAIIFKVL